jgi:hypothetical protein
LELSYFLRTWIHPAGGTAGTAGAGTLLRTDLATASDSIHAGPFKIIDETHLLVLPLSISPNIPFDVSYIAYAWGTYEAFANLDISIDFAGLPAGYTVSSCQGFSTMGEEPVPVTRSSWGRLKTLYR